jgi:DNA-binding response OmpR family regulator
VLKQSANFWAKPFSAHELVAHIKVALRRYGHRGVATDFLSGMLQKS